MTARPALRLGSLCSGYGGLDLAVTEVLGAEPVWQAETDPGASAVLARHWPTVPNLGDITAVDFRAVPRVDVLTAGFPCQDVSSAGLRRGIAPGTRSGLWSHVARAVEALRPSLVVIENVRGLLSARAHSDVEPCPWCLGDTDAKPALRALGAVLGDLAGLGFDAEWAGLPASAVLAPHQRWREFALAWPAAPLPADLGHQRGRGARSRRPGPEDRGLPAADAERVLPGDDGELPPRRDTVRRGIRDDAPRCGATPADAAGPGHRDAGTSGLGGLPAAAVAGGPASAAHPHRGRGEPRPEDVRAGQPDVDWGDYAPALQRWEHVLGRPAPTPTDPEGRLAPAFVEWLMGLPEGWVTDTPGLSRSAQLRALGNGVVPQQAAAALRLLLDRTPAGIRLGAVVEGRAA